MKPTENHEDCPCPLCFKRELMEQVLEYCADSQTGVFDVVGVLEAVKHDLLELMNAKDFESSQEPTSDGNN